MADTIIFPLSEETGLAMLAALERIADALEASNRNALSAEVVDDELLVSGRLVSESGGMVTFSDGAMVDDNGILRL